MFEMPPRKVSAKLLLARRSNIYGILPRTLALVLLLQLSPGIEAPTQFVQVSPSTSHRARV